MSTTTTTKSYAVTGMTCSHCIAAVSAELGALTGVSDVHVNLVAGGISTVTVSSDPPLTTEQITTALDEAGDYRLSTDQPR
jgi:copper chaperone CopZ